MMKYKLIFLIVFGFTYLFKAQSTNDLGKIKISVIMPEKIDGLDFSQLSKLETKIIQIITASGLSSSSYNNNFVIYPKFTINENNIVEGGMQNINVVNVELSLFIKQIDNNIIFSSLVKSLKGSGSNKELAISNSISKIPINDPEFKTFIETGKTKIIQYYESKCAEIIKKSENYASMQQFEQAIGLLMTVPEEVGDCYNQTQEKAIEIYKALQSQKCAELTQKAKTLLAKNNYLESLNALSEIDPSTSCFNEAQKIAKVAEEKVDAEEKKQWDFQMKQYNDDVSLKKLRIEAIKEIAVSYYKSQPTNVNYNYLIK